MKKEINKYLLELVRNFFQNKQNTLITSELKFLDELLNNNIVKPVDDYSKVVRFNPLSIELNKILLTYCQETVGITEFKSIKDVNKTFGNFIKTIKVANGNSAHNPFKPITDGFYGFLLGLLRKSGFDVYTYAISKVKSESLDRYSDDFDRGFNFHLFTDQYSIEEIYVFCLENSLSQNQLAYNDLEKLLLDSSDLLYSLYQFGNKNELFEQCEFQLRLLPKMFDLFPDEILSITDNILKVNPINGIRILANCNLSTQQIDKVLVIAHDKLKDISVVAQLNYLLFKTVINRNVTLEQKYLIYKLWGSLLNVSDSQSSLQIINNIQLIENEIDDPFKYKLLIQYLNKTQNFTILKNFFFHFKNPIFTYKLLADQYQLVKGRKHNIINMFRSPLKHFFRTNPVESEECILLFFDPQYRLNTLPIQIMMLDNPNVFFVDLLKIKEENVQLSSIKSFLYVTHDFEKILPSLITLQKSSFPSVIKSLQIHLSFLAYESYGQNMVDWLTPLVKGKGSKAFLKPIIEAVHFRNEEMKAKFLIKDINPIYHEKNLYHLYLSLSQESHSKAMQSTRNSPGFLGSMFKNSLVVRGNSCRIGDLNSKVVPLSTISVSSTIDSRLYKNPELFEFNQNNYE